jgi:hypothetical protein
MAPEQSQLPIVDSPKSSCCNGRYVLGGMLAGIILTALLGTAFFWGRQTAAKDSQPWVNGIPANRLHPDFLSASASHGGVNMAVCTAQVDENAEGFFTLDYLTGDLKGWVYYPRQAAFGGMFMTNVQGNLGMSKNPEYLLVSGAATPKSLGGNIRPAASLIYVVDMRSGYFAAYTIPWDRTSEASAVPQSGSFTFVARDQIREPWGAGVKKPANQPAPGQKNPGKPNDPNNPDPNADPTNPAAPPQAPAPNNPNNKRPRN